MFLNAIKQLLIFLKVFIDKIKTIKFKETLSVSKTYHFVLSQTIYTVRYTRHTNSIKLNTILAIFINGVRS